MVSGWFLWVMVASALPGSGNVPRNMISRLRRGHYDVVTTFAQQQLAQHPQNPDMLGLLGSVQVSQGRFAEGIELLTLSEGADFYEHYGIRYHADALRGLGDGAGAARLRQERQVLRDYPTDWEHYDMLYQIEDYLSAGDTAAAREAADAALSLDPSRPVYAAMYAEILMAEGDLAGAESWLSLAEHLSAGTTMQEVIHAEARLSLAQGDPVLAGQILQPHARRNPMSVDYWYLLGESHRQQGHQEAVEEILGMVRFSTLTAPLFTALRARLLRDQGDLAGAQVLVEDARADAPGNPVLRQVAAELGLP